jgi:hypothetical protein
MRNTTVASVVLLGSILAVGCEQTPTGIQSPALAASDPALAVTSGETFSHILISQPSAKSLSLAVGASSQMASTLHYNRGGTLPSAPYAQWRSTDPCVATVTNASPSWGMVRGVKSGTTRIISEAWGKADTITVTVTGTGDLDPTCASRQWVWNSRDVSFTGSPASSYGVASGEKLRRVVLFAGPRPDYTLDAGGKVTLRSELWYDKGGKLNGRGYVVFSSTDESVATINSKGVVTARGSGRTKIIARLGTTLADTVPLYVR